MYLRKYKKICSIIINWSIPATLLPNQKSHNHCHCHRHHHHQYNKYIDIYFHINPFLSLFIIFFDLHPVELHVVNDVPKDFLHKDYFLRSLFNRTIFFFKRLIKFRKQSLILLEIFQHRGLSFYLDDILQKVV